MMAITTRSSISVKAIFVRRGRRRPVESMGHYHKKIDVHERGADDQQRVCLVHRRATSPLLADPLCRIINILLRPQWR